jgi:hypothetical protein
VPFHGIRVALIFVTAIGLHGQAPPHAGWKFVPGGNSLLSNGYWDINRDASEPYVLQVSDGVLNASALSGYLGGNNVLAPRLETTGDFGVVATTGPGTIGFAIQLTGSPNTGAQYWQGLTFASFGFDDSGNFYFSYADGTQPSGTYKILKGVDGKAQNGNLTMELLR